MSHHSHSPTPHGLHKDWRLWIAVALMFVAILTYALTLDDSFAPEVTTGNQALPSAAPAQP